MKKYFLGAFTLIVLVIGFLAVLTLTQENQDIREKAAVSGGKGKVTLNPQTVTKYPGDKFSTVIKFRTGTTAANALPISSIVFSISYPYSGAAPELDVVDPDGNPSNQIYPDSGLLSSGDWSFPVKKVTRSAGLVTIDFAAINFNVNGYSSFTEAPLATIHFKANRVPPTNPVALSFSSTLSSMLTKADPPQEILDIPVNGSYSIQNDTTAPAAIINLTASGSTKDSITLSWTAPTDIGPTGKVSSYDLRYSTSTITGANWGTATRASGEPVPANPGVSQTFTLSGLAAGATYYFALKSEDSAGNVSGLSNIANGNISSATLSFGFKLQGVGTSGLTKPFQVILKNASISKTYTGVSFTSKAQGIFKPPAPLALTDFSIPSGGVTVDVLIKDNNHLRKNLGSLTLTSANNVAPSAWNSLILQGGDFNNSNTLNITDIGKLLSVYTALSIPVTPTNRIYDVNSDNVINITDIALVLANYTALEIPGD